MLVLVLVLVLVAAPVLPSWPFNASGDIEDNACVLVLNLSLFLPLCLSASLTQNTVPPSPPSLRTHLVTVW